MSVIVGVAEVLASAVVLVEDLSVVHATLKERGVSFKEYVLAKLRSGTDIIAGALSLTDTADMHLAVGSLTHTRLKTSSCDLIFHIIFGYKIALYSVSEAGAIYAKQVTV